MKILRNLLIFLLSIYFLICVALFFGQENIFFLPSKLSEKHIFRKGKEVEVKVAEGLSLNCLMLKEQNAKGVILYLHGNKGSNRRCLHQAETMANNQYDIFMPDYRGYGKSDGEIISEQQIYMDMQKVYDYLKQTYKENQIVIVGYSLGTGMASWLAAKNNPKRLILLAPYLSFVDLKDRRFSLIPDFIVKYPLSNEAHLKEVKCPVNIFHGTNDSVIPFDSSVKLAALYPSKVSFIKMNGESHRGAIFNRLFRSKVRELLAHPQNRVEGF